ncbi:MAG: alpha/beta fold hydrolase, partial [Fibrobacteria bacterium]
MKEVVMNSSRKVLLTVTCIFALSATVSSRTTFFFKVAGATRVSNIYVPTGIKNPPLVFYVHGAGGHANYFEDFTKGNNVADREKFIAAYPGAASQPGEKGTWQDMQGTTNYAFFKAVIDSLDALYKIDRTRIYMTGFSQGGFISFAMACNYADVFAAIAPSSGHSPANCAPKRPVPVFMTFGSLEGPASFLKDRDAWVKLDKCTSAEKITKPFPASNSNSKAALSTYTSCDQGVSVLMDSVSGQDHRWPETSNMNFAEEGWAFLKQYSLDKTTDIRPQMTAPSLGSVSYSEGFIRLEGLEAESRVTVADARGRVMAIGTGLQPKMEFKDKPRGVYVVKVSQGN